MVKTYILPKFDGQWLHSSKMVPKLGRRHWCLWMGTWSRHIWLL